MRPRDRLRLLRECVNVAVNRGHAKVTAADMVYAEKAYSADQLQEVSSELRDVAPELPDILYDFIGCSPVLSEREVLQRLSSVVLLRPDALELLLWFGFLGVLDGNGNEKYAYEFNYGVKRLLQEASRPPQYVVHPAFRTELGCASST